MVTFLFSDIEGSTRLWERDPVAMRDAAARHDALLRDAIERHAGILYKHVGDAVQAAFVDPAAAVAAVVAAQRALTAAAWPETGPIRVRMALHLGEAAPNHAGDYHQVPALNRLARLLATGFGGQVLLSDAVRRRVAAQLPDGVTLLDLGRHRLRDLLEPERVAQLVIEGLPAHFPPLKSLEGFPTNLPRQPNPLVGRLAELAELATLVTDPDVPLLTLVGPGGAGKTRLALQTGAEALDSFPDGVWLVEFGAVTDPELILPIIAGVLGLREGGGLSLERQLEEYLAPRRLLLILDNLEHLVDGVQAISDLIGSCPELTILTTSRRPLELRAERLVQVAPLLAPPEERHLPHVDALGRIEAVDLLVQRVRARDSKFALTAENAAAIAAICRRLDGLPLALELAAARIPALPPHELLAELDHRFELLTGGSRDLLPHQQALETTIAWSYDLLPPETQAVFRRLSVFAGDFTREAVETVVPAAGTVGRFLTGTLLDLVSDSLLRLVTDTSPARYVMLESLRAFGRQRLAAAGEAEATGRAHTAFFRALTLAAAPHLNSAEQGVWFDRLQSDHENLRAGLDWALTAGEERAATEMVETLWQFWLARGHLSEGRRRVEATIDRFGMRPAAEGASAAGGPKLPHAAGTLARAHGDYAAAGSWFEIALARARTSGDRGAEAAALNNLGSVSLAVGNHRRAADLYTQSLVASRSLGDRRREAATLSNLGAVAHYLGETEQAEESYLAALVLWEELGDARRASLLRCNLALLLAPLPPERERARTYAERGLADSQALGFPGGIATARTALGWVAEGEGNLAEAIRHYEESVRVFRESEDRSGLARGLGNLGLVVADHGDPQRGGSLLRESLEGFVALSDDEGIATSLEMLASIARATGDVERAARLHGAAAARLEEIAIPLPAALARRHQISVTALRAALGDAAFETAWESGKGMSVELALRDVAESTAASETEKDQSISSDRDGFGRRVGRGAGVSPCD
jgi:predicted ATPase/class 3 adenylate cyclase